MLHTQKEAPSSIPSDYRIANSLFYGYLASFQKSRTQRRSSGLASLIEDQLICLGHLLAVRSDSLSLSAAKDDLHTLIEVLQHVRPIVLRLDEQARELRQGYAGLLQEANNRMLNMLAILSAIYLPSTLVAGIYGMNFEDIPITDAADGYLVVLLLMISLVAGQFEFLGPLRAHMGICDPRSTRPSTALTPRMAEAGNPSAEETAKYLCDRWKRSCRVAQTAENMQ